MTSEYEFVSANRDFRPDEARDQKWQDSSSHRAQILKILKAESPANSKTLSVWGAGACNDLELNELIKCYKQIDLVDADRESVLNGVKVQGLSDDSRINLLAETDLAGNVELLKEYRKQPSDSLAEKILTESINHQLEGIETYDVVVSTCMLSQLVNSIVIASGGDTNLIMKWMPDVRAKHLELILRHTKPGGTSLLITDLTSSVAMPAILDQASSVKAMFQKVCEGNHFHGLNPLVLRSELSENRIIANLIERWDQSIPWRWNGTNRWYLCIGYRMLRSKSD